VPATIGAVISAGRATLHELDTVYGVEDLYDLLELAAIDAHNRWLMSEKK
jgi:hypothetical protein